MFGSPGLSSVSQLVALGVMGKAPFLLRCLGANHMSGVQYMWDMIFGGAQAVHAVGLKLPGCPSLTENRPRAWIAIRPADTSTPHPSTSPGWYNYHILP